MNSEKQFQHALITRAGESQRRGFDRIDAQTPNAKAYLSLRHASPAVSVKSTVNGVVTESRDEGEGGGMMGRDKFGNLYEPFKSLPSLKRARART